MPYPKLYTPPPSNLSKFYKILKAREIVSASLDRFFDGLPTADTGFAKRQQH